MQPIARVVLAAADLLTAVVQLKTIPHLNFNIKATTLPMNNLNAPMLLWW
jgi:hypothetical protein